jgi:hypothetical protein
MAFLHTISGLASFAEFTPLRELCLPARRPQQIRGGNAAVYSRFTAQTNVGPFE